MGKGFSKAQQDYLSALHDCVHHVESQNKVLEDVCQRIFKSFRSGGVMHVFGSGHAHILAEEMFHRAGGLVPVNAMLEEYLMPHMTPRRVGPLERTSGLADMILNFYEPQKGEVILVVSQSGINPVGVEVAEKAKERGLFVVAVTSVTHSKSVPSRAAKKLFEVADAILDTGTPIGDAAVKIAKADVNVAPLSTVISAVIGELIVARVSELYSEAGETPPVYQSANVPGGEARNKSFEEKYRGRIKKL